MKMSRLLAAMAMVLAACCAGNAGEKIVTLTIQEEAGFARVNEPMTVGVPLPEGKVKNVALLYLTDEAGKEIPCQITEVCKWLDREHVKWVHLTWNQSVGANGSADVTLMLREAVPPGAVPPRITASQDAGKVTVSNRFVKFTVVGKNFDGFHQAWFDATGKGQFDAENLVIIDRGGGSKVSVGGKEFLSTNDPDGKVEIEEQGTQRVVVKATGRHIAGGEKALDYIVRFYAYADSPVVRVSHTFVCAQGTKPADHLLIDRMTFDVPTSFAGGKALIGTEKEPLAAALPASINQRDSDLFVATGPDASEPIMGKGKSTKPLTTGWVDVTNGDLGVAVGIKWFWQMCPKAITVGKDGSIGVELFPPKERRTVDRPLEAFMGISRTHYLTFVFHDAKTDATALNAIFAGANKPLRAWAPGKYYCRDTHAFGYAVENDEALFGENWPKVQAWNGLMLECLKMAIRTLDNKKWNIGQADSYGIYAWGDQFHWDWPEWEKSPRQTPEWKLSWEGNYYDYPNAMIMAYLRTGEKLYLERFFPNAIQIGDVHTANYHPNPALIGGCRYCPPRNFVATDDGNPYISNEFNHWKSQSVFAHWYLTGDLRSLDHCRMLMNAAFENRAADRGWAARGIGAQMLGLWNAYELTLDKKYFDRLKGLAESAMREFKNGSYPKSGDFMFGIANEGLVHYYWISGDERVIDTLKTGLPKCRAKTAYPNMALGNALVYRVTGDKQFADWAWACLTKLRPSGRVHGPSCQFRGTHFALYFLSDASKDWKPAAAPK